MTRRVERGRDLPRPLDQRMIEGVQGGPVLRAAAADGDEGRIEQGSGLPGAVGRNFQLTEHLEPARDERQRLIEGGNALAATRIGAGEAGEGSLAHGTGKVRRAIERFVVEQHGDALGAEAEVDLHGVRARQRGAYARERVWQAPRQQRRRGR